MQLRINRLQKDRKSSKANLRFPRKTLFVESKLCLFECLLAQKANFKAFVIHL